MRVFVELWRELPPQLVVLGFGTIIVALAHWQWPLRRLAQTVVLGVALTLLVAVVAAATAWHDARACADPAAGGPSHMAELAGVRLPSPWPPLVFAPTTAAVALALLSLPRRRDAKAPPPDAPPPPDGPPKDDAG